MSWHVIESRSHDKSSALLCSDRSALHAWSEA
jgi:hypothetical protein